MRFLSGGWRWGRRAGRLRRNRPRPPPGTPRPPPFRTAANMPWLPTNGRPLSATSLLSPVWPGPITIWAFAITRPESTPRRSARSRPCWPSSPIWSFWIPPISIWPPANSPWLRRARRGCISRPWPPWIHWWRSSPRALRPSTLCTTAANACMPWERKPRPSRRTPPWWPRTGSTGWLPRRPMPWVWPARNSARWRRRARCTRPFWRVTRSTAWPGRSSFGVRRRC